VPVNPELLSELGIVVPEADMRLMDRAQLAELFAAQSSGRIMLAPLMRSLIVQAHGAIESGSEPPVRGNLRTFWYRYAKPVLVRIPDDDFAKTPPYDTMIREFRNLVLDQKLFAYVDFDFTDENWENRRIGTRRPDVLVFAEKTGWVRFLREVHEDLGVSTLALGGAPSALTSEYTARALRAVMDGPGPVELIGVVDFDPDGELIALAFQKQLAALGLTETRLQTVIDPGLYSEAEIRMFRYPLSKARQYETKVSRWVDRSGGLDGQRFGLEAESLPLERVRRRVDALVREVF